MKKCNVCGEVIEEDNVTVCPKCGAELITIEEKPIEENKEEVEKEDFSTKFTEKFTNTKDSTNEFDAKDIEENRTISIFAYLSILVLIPLFAAKDSKFARFHCNQGLLLAIVEVVASVVFSLLGLIPYIGWIFYTIMGIIDLCAFVLLILGIMNVINGNAKELPFIGHIHLMKY